LEKHLENYAASNHKATMTQEEVYKYINDTYNTILHHRAHIVTCGVGFSSVSLPTCLYMGTFQTVWKKWIVDVKRVCDERRSHQNWLTNREQDIAHQRRRRRNCSSILEFFSTFEEGKKRGEERRGEGEIYVEIKLKR
jgi:hypothetical protein